MKKLVLKCLPAIDILLVLFVYPAALLIKYIRIAGVHRMLRCKNALIRIGVFPIRNHYFEPQFDYRNHGQNYFQDRNLQGINWNVSDQLELLEKFSFSDELLDIPQKKTSSLKFHLNNGAFESGDADYWYQIIRFVKPRRIVEIGSGYSTLLAIDAIKKNKTEDLDYTCTHVCIEPYEMSWLEKVGVTVVRKKVEEIELSFFSQLQEGDILFIDSSHIIRPQGDVLFEYLELLPSLNTGVIVHIHDIFSPNNYPVQWIQDEIRFWNEQYILEAFLSHNGNWKIIGALNYLHHNHYEKFSSVSPLLTPEHEPGSFYIQKIVGKRMR